MTKINKLYFLLIVVFLLAFKTIDYFYKILPEHYLAFMWPDFFKNDLFFFYWFLVFLFLVYSLVYSIYVLIKRKAVLLPVLIITFSLIAMWPAVLAFLLLLLVSGI